ncbi:MAG: hypothetical protein ACOH1I_09235 [Gallionellaceae bacterium]
MTNRNKQEETHAVTERYGRRHVGDRYSMLRSEVWLGVQERQRAMLRLFGQDIGWTSLANLKLTEVGCSSGGNLLDFLRFGFAPHNLCCIELLPERAAAATDSFARACLGEGLFREVPHELCLLA